MMHRAQYYITRAFTTRVNRVNREESPPRSGLEEWYVRVALLSSISEVLGAFKTRCYTRTSHTIGPKISRFTDLPDYSYEEAKLIFHFHEVANNGSDNFRVCAKGLARGSRWLREAKLSLWSVSTLQSKFRCYVKSVNIAELVTQWGISRYDV